MNKKLAKFLSITGVTLLTIAPSLPTINALVPIVAKADSTIDSLVPDTKFQTAIMNALNNNAESSPALKLTDPSQITKSDMQNITYFNKSAQNASITNLQGLQYLTNLKQIDLTGNTIEQGPDDWSVLKDTNYDNLGTLDLDKITNFKGFMNIPTNYSVKFKGNLTFGRDNIENSGPGVTQTFNIPASQITSSGDKATIPVSSIYKGFLQSDGSYKYGTFTFDNSKFPKGITYDSTNKDIVLDLTQVGGEKLSLTGDLKDIASNSNYFYSEFNINLTAPKDKTDVTNQNVSMPDRSNETGKIQLMDGMDVSKLNAPTIDGDLTSDDITFSKDSSSSSVIDFKLSDSGIKKLLANDSVVSQVNINDGKNYQKTKLTISEPLSTWMPDSNLQSAVISKLEAQGFSSPAITKANVSKLNNANAEGDYSELTLNNVSNLTGLEYATNLHDIMINNSNLNSDKKMNSGILNKLDLNSLSMDSSDLGSSLNGWGLSNHLNYLTVTNSNLSDTDLSSVLNDDLNYLNLNDNKLSSSNLLSQISKLKSLQQLKLSNNSFNESLPDFTSSNITNLYLDGNKFSGTIPETWKNLTKMQQLALQGNNLNGTLDNLNEMTNITKLNLDGSSSTNQFTGNIPSNIFTSNLTHLEVANNKLTGSLPSTINDSKNLEYLDVSSNELTGDLPTMSLPKLGVLAYGGNHITSGLPKPVSTTAGGNYQTFSIDNPDWKQLDDQSGFYLELNKYYKGIQGQDYSNLSVIDPSQVTNPTLDLSNPSDPLLKISNSDASKINQIFIMDKQGTGTASKSDMDYSATINVAKPDLTGLFSVSASDVDLGTTTAGESNVMANDYSLIAKSTFLSGHEFKIGVTSSGLHNDNNKDSIPLYLKQNDSKMMLSNDNQQQINYYPQTDTDKQVLGDSKDDTKLNLGTDIPSNSYSGKYTGVVQYTMQEVPETNNPSDVTTVSSDTESKVTPVTDFNVLMEQRETLANNVLTYGKSVATDPSDNTVFSDYSNNSPESTKLSETQGLWMLALAMKCDKTTYDKVLNGIMTTLYDKNSGLFAWESNNGTKSNVTASIDDLRIIQSMITMNSKYPGQYTTTLNKLIDDFVKNDSNSSEYMIDSYDFVNNYKENTIRLNYLDLATLKYMYEAKGLNSRVYDQQLKVINNGNFGSAFPFWHTFYDYSSGTYYDKTDNGSHTDQINSTDMLITTLNLAKIGEINDNSSQIKWIKDELANNSGVFPNNYYITSDKLGKAVDPTSDASSNYAYIAQIAAVIGDKDLYSQMISKLQSQTADENRSYQPLKPGDPLYGTTEYGGSTSGFTEFNDLIAYLISK